MATKASTTAAGGDTLDPVLMAVMANRVDGIVREMSNTLLRAARSAVLAVARDFSCAITTGDNQLFSSAEGLPVHIFGSHLQSASMCALHKDLAEGDAFLHNDPYLGNTHPADHMILVPVFFEGEHLFTACAKAHQADIGNSAPTTYHASAKDVYEEGSIIFPCVRVQRDYKMIDDVIRMCEKRIRVPEQWYGDFLAELGAARIAERRLKEFCAKYGKATVKEFIARWLDYSEQRMIQSIKKLPKVRLENRGGHDPIEGVVPDGVPIKVIVEVDPDSAMIDIDLRDNIECLDCGLNESEACAINNVVTGVFNCLDPDTPHNSGSFRRMRVHLKDDCVVGRPAFPHSCSVATTNVGDRLVNITQSAFAQLGDGWGLAEGGGAMGAGFAVIAGSDFRRNGEPYVNQLIACTNGGPASPAADGWVTFGLPVVGGLMYRDSVELDEVKQPIEIKSLRLVQDSAGPGRYRGGPQGEIVFGPKRDPMTIAVVCDGQINPPRGVRGGGPGAAAGSWRVSANGNETKLPNLFLETFHPGEYVRGTDNGGGGYGDPLERDPKRVLDDVLERYVSVDAAREIYGVVLSGDAEAETLAIDEAATAKLRAQWRGGS
ncbi:MAG: hydantoinase B/oxoprolinase family protein [Alphaproteobacteria bacterium]